MRSSHRLPDDPARVLILDDLLQVPDWEHRLAWKPFQDGVDIHRLYGDGRTGPSAALLRFGVGGRVPLHEHTGYEHILVLAGSQVDENSRAETGMLLINPPGTNHSILSENGCIVLAIYEKPVRFLGPEATPEPDMNTNGIPLAVNGTLMRGLELNPNLLEAGATFVREARTAAIYRLWSIGDRHPAMMRFQEGGAEIDLEIWSVPKEGLATILLREPPGLAIGKVQLADGGEVLGVLGEPCLCEGQREITAFGGWRAYKASAA